MVLVIRRPINLDGKAFFPRDAVPENLVPSMTADDWKACVRITDPAPPRTAVRESAPVSDAADAARSR